MLVRLIPFFSRKMPKIQELAAALKTEINNRYADFESIVLVCHSLGGLIARKYLLDEVKASGKTPETAPNRRTRPSGCATSTPPDLS